MKKSLVAKHHLSIPGYGSVTPGEVLQGEPLYLLDDEQIERLLKRGALVVMGGEEEDAPEEDAPTPDAPVDQGDDRQAAEPAPAQAPEAATEDAPAEDASEDAPLEMDATEAIVDAPAPAQAPKQKAAAAKKGAAK